MKKLRAWSRTKGVAAKWWLLDWLDRAMFSRPVEHGVLKRSAVGQAVLHNPPVRTLYVDVSVIHENDAGTGIQRVVRSLREHLPKAVDPKMALEFVVVDKRRTGYVTLAGERIKGAPDSLFFGLDFATDSVFEFRDDLRAFKSAGGQLWFLIHDILPLSHPQWFTPASRLKYRRWLRVSASLADGILCVSPAVTSQVKDLLGQQHGREEGPRVKTIELGSDISPADRRLGVSELPVRTGLDHATFKRSALVVGTIEPRKGHADVLAAFERIWRDGHDIPLVLIGRKGWGTSQLQEQILRHPERGRLLFWLDNVDDRELHAAYRHCHLAIVPSLAEGYGLPLDEALALGAPVVARDIPVFRRHGNAPISFFAEDADTASIASAILSAYEDATRPRRMSPLRQWDETASQVAEALACKHRD